MVNTAAVGHALAVNMGGGWGPAGRGTMKGPAGRVKYGEDGACQEGCQEGYYGEEGGHEEWVTVERVEACREVYY